MLVVARLWQLLLAYRRCCLSGRRWRRVCYRRRSRRNGTGGVRGCTGSARARASRVWRRADACCARRRRRSRARVWYQLGVSDRHGDVAIPVFNYLCRYHRLAGRVAGHAWNGEAWPRGGSPPRVGLCARHQVLFNRPGEFGRLGERSQLLGGWIEVVNRPGDGLCLRRGRRLAG